MTSDQQPTKIADNTVTSGNSKDNLAGASKLLKVISSVDALLIFSMAKDGIEADSKTYSKVGLSRKQYYTRLIQLKKAGLIEKKGKLYYHTTMGAFLHESCVNSIAHAIRNRKRMTMLDVLKQAKKFSDEDLLHMKNAICSIKPSGTDRSPLEIGGIA